MRMKIISIKETKVFVSLTGRTIAHYEALKYEIPRYKNKWGDASVKNGTKIEVLVTDLQPSSDAIITKICDYCGTEVPTMYRAYNKARKFIEIDCCDNKTCVSKKLSESRSKIIKEKLSNPNVKVSLLDRYPEIAKEFNIELNEFSPSEIAYGSSKRVWWTCRFNNEHIWDDSVVHRTTQNRGCPYCHGLRVNHTNCLSKTEKEIALQWHPTLNEELLPDHVTRSSSKVVWWLCPQCDSSYDMMISSRTSGGQNCPYCGGMRVNETNCLAKTHPELLSEWDFKENKDVNPYNINSGSKKYVWWKCSKCDHSWSAQPDSRTGMKSGCPKCAKKSIGEKLIIKELLKRDVLFKIEYKFQDLKSPKKYPMRYDFAVFDKNNKISFMIEFDEEYHFAENRKSYPKTKEYDNIKNEYCSNNKIPLVRIPYWDINNIEEIIAESINTYM
nr:zinc-ribbon domain-containing protein [Mycobacterium sp. E3298]